MSAWATAAWDNDSAADWFGDMFDATGVAKYVEETLRRDTEEYYDEIRAAAYMLVALGRVYIWPIEDLDRHLALAVFKLEEVRSLDVFEGESDFRTAIDEEIAVLKSRQKNPGT